MHLFLIFVPEEVSFMNKWVSVVLCICGLGLGGMMLTGDSDGGRVLIENAPYITDGKINPNHEGKVVIVAARWRRKNRQLMKNWVFPLILP